MISRRQVIVTSGGAFASAGVGWTVGLAQASAPRAEAAPTLFLHDHSIEGAEAAARLARDAGASVTAFHEDVGVPWFNVIEPMWRQRAQPIAGITYRGTLFCLEQLARNYRLACTFRIAIVQPSAERLKTAARLLLRAGSQGAPSVADDAADAPVAWLLQPIVRNSR